MSLLEPILDFPLPMAEPNNDRLRILFVSSYFKDMGGAEKNILELIRGLDKERYVCSLAALQGGSLLLQAQQAGATVWNINLAKIFSWAALRKGLDLMRAIRRYNVGVVITYHHDADIWGGFFALLAGVPVIASRRDIGFMLEKKHVWCYRLLNRFFARTITVSDAVKDLVCAREWTPKSKIATIYNGVEFEATSSTDVRQKKADLGLDPNSPVVGMVANFRPVKGQEFFVEAASQILKTHPDAQFVIAGSNKGAYFEQVMRQMRALGVQRHFVMLGERKDVTDILPAFDVFVLSSLHEGFSNAIVEAMAAGVPVVASNSGGNPEAVENGVSGILVPPKDSDALAHAIDRLLSDEVLRASMARRGWEILNERFRYDTMIEKFSALIDDSVGRSQSSVGVPA